MNKTLLLNKQGSSIPGYIPAKLTIGKSITIIIVQIGYSVDSDEKEAFGNLEPNTGYSKLYVAAGGTVYCTKPFYYAGTLYTQGDNSETLYNTWNTLLDQTVDVLIEGG